MMTKHKLVTLFLLLSLFLAASNAFANTKTKTLFNIINERLSYMESVALYKAAHRLPIEDSEREKVVLTKALESADELQIDKSSLSHFFEVQIRVAKAIQYRHRADLLHVQEVRQTDDLIAVIRPKLIELSARLNSVLNDVVETGGINEQDRMLFTQTVNHRYLLESDKKHLFDALRQIKSK